MRNDCYAVRNDNQIAVYRSALIETYRRDFPRYAREQLKLRGAQPGSILPFNFKPIQSHIWQREDEQRKEKGYIRACVVKPRQPGSSTLAQGTMFWQASLNQNFSCLLLALDDDNTSNIFNMSRFFYENLNPLIRPVTRYSSKRELVFDADKRRNPGAIGLGSSMQFQNSTRVQAGTGTTRHGVHISEASKFNPDACTFLEQSLMPAIHLLPGTIVINESTTFVNGDWFRGCCDRARSGLSEFILIFVPWWFEPEYQLPLDKGEHFKRDREEKWLAALAAKGQPNDQVPPFNITDEQLKWRRLIMRSRQDGERFFDQEFPKTYDSAWINLDLQVFDARKLHEMERHIMPTPEIVGEIFPGPKVRAGGAHFNVDSNYFAVFKKPEPGKQYDIGCDVAVGIEGGDWSTAEVFERNSREQVAELHVQMDVFDFSEKLYWLGYYYNVAQLCIEINSVGSSVHGRVASMSYPYLYRWRHRDRDVPQITKMGGWLTAKNSKPYLVATFRSALLHDELIIHSRLLLEEMRDFVTIPGYSDFGGDQYRAQRGHDDLVMATGMALVSGDDEKSGLARGPGIVQEEMNAETIAARIAAGPWSRDSGMGREAKPRDFTSEMIDTLRGWK